MKKLTRTSLSALKSESAVLTEQQQRAIKGGCSMDDMGVGYWDGNNYHWYRTSECTCGSGGYYWGDEGSGGHAYLGGSDYPGMGTRDCVIQSIAAITGLSLETIHGYAAEYLQVHLNISSQSAWMLAGLGLSEDVIDSVLEMAGGSCFNLSINENYSASFNQAIGLINGHVVQVLSYDSGSGLVTYTDPQRDNETGVSAISSFAQIKAFHGYY